MTRNLPSIAMLLGIAGLIPFVVCGLGALANPPPNDAYALMALIAYGAVILAFLGGVHWGFALDGVGAPSSTVQLRRFGLGIMPSLFGWVALLLAIVGYTRIALALLVLSFILVTMTEARASRHGYMPKGYMGLRWVLSVIVVVVLCTVWVMLMLDGRIHLW